MKLVIVKQFAVNDFKDNSFSDTLIHGITWYINNIVRIFESDSGFLE